MMRRSILFLLLVALVVSVTGCAGCRTKVKPPTPPISEPSPTGPIGDPRTDLTTQWPSTGYLEVVYFDFDKSTIRADQVKNAEGNAKWLIANPTMKILIEGHCDERGTTEYNFQLGNRRADAMSKFLISRGVNAENISVISKGEEEPAAQGSNEDAWGKNRRDEFKFLSKPPAK